MGQPRRRLWPWLLGIGAAVGITGTVAVVVVVVLVGLAILALVAVVVVFGLVYLVTSPVSNAPEFVDALAQDNDRAAYGLLCDKTASVVSFEDFVARFAPARPVLSVTKVTSSEGFSSPPSAVEATFMFEGGTSRTLVYTTEPDSNGNLRVCSPPTFQN